MENLEKILNKEQCEAVRCTEGPLLVLAGAGSGKTRVLTHRVADLIENCGVAPWNILAITFTNKAAGEMRERVDRLIGTQAREVWVSTFHSMCVRILRRYIDRLGYKSDFSIYDTDDQRTLMRQVLKELSIDPKMFKERVVLSVISGAKNRGVSPLEFRKEEASGGDLRMRKMADCFELYEKKLHQNDALDFDDEEDREAAIEAVYYQMALGMIYGSMGPGTPFTSQTMLDIHSMLRFGRLASESGTKVRTREYHPRTHDDGTPLHVPPTPAEAPALLDELCVFVGSDLYSPIGQAAVAHFQLEEIKPFKTGLDRTGRLLSHAIIYRRGLSRGLVAPIGLAPAIDTDRHARSLLPYRFEDTQGRVDVEEAVGRWARFCAESVLVCCQAADVYLGEILSLRDAWLERFGKPNKGSAVGALLGLMPGQPVLTVRQAALLLGRSISSTNEALLRLEDAGIVASEDGFGRNGIYRAVEAEALLESLENRFIPNCPVARDSFGG